MNVFGWGRQVPVLFLDVDGVVAPFAQRQPGMRVVPVGGWHGTVVVVPSVVDRLAGLHADGRIRIEWLTSWEEDADLVLAPLIGLGRYRVHVEPAVPVSRLYWKEQVVRDHAVRYGSCVWVDDEMVDHGSDVSVPTDFPGVMVVAPDCRVGLTHEHVDRIEEFLGT